MSKFSRANDCLNCPYQSESFSFLNIDEKKTIQNNCIIADFKRGENISKLGLNVTNAIFISKGLVKLFLHSEKKNIILKLAKGGEYVALSTVFGDNKYSFSISAIDDSRVCMVNSDVFKSICENNNKFMISINKQLSNETNFILRKIEFFNQKSIRARLADVLLFLSDELYKSDEFTLTLTRQELGDLISLSRENTIKILRDFKTEKIVEIDGKKIKIINKQILETIKNIG